MKELRNDAKAIVIQIYLISCLKAIKHLLQSALADLYALLTRMYIFEVSLLAEN
jgi:hypothetical protein